MAPPQELNYADPNIFISGPTDVILIVAELFFNLLLLRRLSPGEALPAENSNLSKTQIINKHIHCAISNFKISSEELDAQVNKFWEVENIHIPFDSSIKHSYQEYFISSTTSDIEGRYIVSLPKKLNAPALDTLRNLAVERLYSLERRLSKDIQNF